MSHRQPQFKYDLPLEEYGTCRNEGDNGGSSSQSRRNDLSYSRDNFGKWNPHYHYGKYKLQASHFQEDDGTTEMRIVQKSQVRHAPYTVGQDRRRVRQHNEGHLSVTVKIGKYTQREVRKNLKIETEPSWFKIIVPGGIKYEKMWLINLIQSYCYVPFIPVEFHYVQDKAQFFVQDARAAYALRAISCKIYDERNQKIPIFISASAVPFSVWDKLKPDTMEQLKLTMNKRYNVSQKALELQFLRYDPDLVSNDVVIALNRRNCMTATLQIIEKNFPELLSLNLHSNRLCQLDGLSEIIERAPTVKILNLAKNKLTSTWELVKIKDLNLEELWLKGNPLCDTFPDQSTYISAIRKIFPKLLYLDGQYLAPPITIYIDGQHLIPSKESTNGCDDQKNLVLQFLQQYYLIYDSGDRQGLHSVYHDKACFSLTISVNPDDPALSSLFKYFKDNRNMKNLKDPNMRFQLLKHTKRDIVCSLCALPETQHDVSSFVVDMWSHSENMLLISVSGVFKEVEGWSQGCVRAFNRTFITTSASNSSLCVMNEEFSVRDITPKETESGLSTQAPTAASSSEPSSSQKQQEVMKGKTTEE